MKKTALEQDLLGLVQLLYREVLILRSQMDDVHALFKPRTSVNLSKKEIHKQKVEQKQAEIMARLIAGR